MTIASPPSIIYGTAWKEDRTTELVKSALAAGFRAVDTACQRKHYHEAGVGQALAEAFSSGLVKREDLFLQTKFTFRGGQDHRLPYDPDAPVQEQVRQSFATSLEHLGLQQIDSYVLHGPTTPEGLGALEWGAWEAMEDLCREGRTRFLGISNVRPPQVELLCSKCRIPPTFVQNRCFAATGWDAEMRDLCRQRGILYQGFSLLTANSRELGRPEIMRMAQRHGRTLPQIVFRLARQIGIIPLTGTCDPVHMRQDLNSGDFSLSPAEVETLLAIGV